MISDLDDTRISHRPGNRRGAASALRALIHSIGCRRRLPYLLVLAIFFSLGHLAGAVQKEQQFLKTKVVIAERYELRTPDGKLAASLGTGAQKQTLLSFFDQQGTARLALGITKDGKPGVFLTGANGLPRLSLVAGPGRDDPAIALCDDQGTPAVTLSLVKGVGPTLTIGRTGRKSIALNVSKEGSSSIAFYDDAGKSRILLANPDEGPQVTFFDNDTRMRASLKLDADGSPKLILYDGNGKERLVAQTDKQGRPSIRFIDPANDMVKELASDLR
jgi:hypothetical protein